LVMDSMDYHMLGAFRYEVAKLEHGEILTNGNDGVQERIDIVITYMKSRIHELERKFKQS
jgi:hypothetical protein